MKKPRILVVAPYEGLREILAGIGRERDDVEITAYQADLELGAELVSQLDESEYDAIISRGGTAGLIREVSQLPVIEIAFSHYDVMSAIKLAEAQSGRCAIVGFASICKMAKVVRDILGQDIDIVQIDKTADATPAIKKLADKGYTTILGDTISFAVAGRLGLKAILIASSRENAETAVEDAMNFCRHLEKLREQNRILNAVTRLGGGGVIAYQDDTLIFSNIKKQKRLFLEVTRKMHPFVLRNKKHIIIQKIDGVNVKFSGHLRQLEGRASYFYIIKQIDGGENPIIPGVYTILKEDNPSGFVGLDLSYDSSQSLTQEIARQGGSTLPVIIVGEYGTGKERVAKMLYQSAGDKNPCYCIDFDELDAKGFVHLLGNPNSCLLRNENTIYLKNIHTLPEEKLQKLLGFIENSRLHLRNRLIISLTTSLDGLNQKFAYRLINSRIPCLTLKLNPLRHRTEDIPGLLGVFLGEINAAWGIHLMGCEPEGVELLKKFGWEYNLGQLKRVLSALAAISKGPYILASDVRWVLENESRGSHLPESGGVKLNLNQCLSSITRDILAAVLTEEGMNQTKAAKRLGISRTTLWRMMQR